MKLGPRTFCSASLQVRECEALPAHMRDSTREVVALEVPEADRRRGYARELMERTVAEADAAGLLLIIVPAPYGDAEAMSREQLAQWYCRRFGFRAIQHEPLILARQPLPPARMLGAPKRSFKLERRAR